MKEYCSVHDLVLGIKIQADVVIAASQSYDQLSSFDSAERLMFGCPLVGNEEVDGYVMLVPFEHTIGNYMVKQGMMAIYWYGDSDCLVYTMKPISWMGRILSRFTKNKVLRYLERIYLSHVSVKDVWNERRIRLNSLLSTTRTNTKEN